MEHFIALFQSAEYRDGVFYVRLCYQYCLETALQRGVFLDVFSVLVEGGRAYAVQLAPCEHRFQQVARVHSAVGLARADYGVQLVDEEDYPALALFYLLQYRFQPLFKLAAVLRARYQRAHIKRKYLAVFQIFGHIALYYTLCQTLYYGGLADARLAYQNRVVLGLAREYAYNVSYLVISADNGVELVVFRQRHEVLTVLFKHVVSALGVLRRDLLVAAKLLHRLEHLFFLDAELLEYPLQRVVRRVGKGEQYVLYRDVAVLHFVRSLFREREGGVQLLRDVHSVVCRRAGNLRQLCDLCFGCGGYAFRVSAHRAQHFGDKPVLLRGERREKVLLVYRLI